jgi:AcrR family transcriptional regulator
MVRPKVPLISRSMVAEHSLKIIDTEGLDRLTVSRLAKALGVSHTSLYHHYRSKDDILDDVLRFALREIEVPPPEVDVRDWLVTNALEYRRMLARHPHLAPLMTKWSLKTNVPVYEHAQHGIRALGVSESDTEAILRAVEALILGWSALEQGNTAGEELRVFERCYRTMLDALITQMSRTGAIS